MKYGIAINGKFALINEDENRIRKTITLCMPQYSAAQIKTYDDSEVEQGHDGNWYEKGHAPQRPLEEIKVAKLIELGTAFEKASQTAHCLSSAGFEINADGTQHTMLDGTDVEDRIRRLDVSSNVSAVSAIAEVRAALVAMQQAYGAEKGIVMDGRDIGTTVFPHAEMKIFMNASAETRAERRLQELIGKGQQVTFEEVLANVVRRDHLDQTRKESPLRRADDAIDLDNSRMTKDEQNAWLLARYRETIEKLS